MSRNNFNIDYNIIIVFVFSSSFGGLYKCASRRDVIKGTAPRRSSDRGNAGWDPTDVKSLYQHYLP